MLLTERIAAAQQHKSGQDKKVRIAIQGVEGAFHHEAALHFVDADHAEIVESPTFDDLIGNVERGEADCAVMAIENTIAGSLLRNYNLLFNSELKIYGEYFLRIRQNLMALPGVSIFELEEVHSHPIAIEQCTDFLKKYPFIQVVTTTDTALAARNIKQGNLSHIAAIASEEAARLYGLHILAESIETYKKNFTRFLLIARSDSGIKTDLSSANKASIVFTTQHTSGSLHKVLAILADNACNLTKIQSVPVMDNPWNYMFFCDFTLENMPILNDVLKLIRTQTVSLEVLGVYKSFS